MSLLRYILDLCANRPDHLIGFHHQAFALTVSTGFLALQTFDICMNIKVTPDSTSAAHSQDPEHMCIATRHLEHPNQNPGMR